MDSILEVCSKFLKRKVYICNQLLLETSSVHHLPLLPISWRLAPRPLASSQSHRQTARNGTCHECSANFSGSSGTSPEPLLNDRAFSPVTTHFTIWSTRMAGWKKVKKSQYGVGKSEPSVVNCTVYLFSVDPLAERTKVFILKICQNVMKTWTQIISPLNHNFLGRRGVLISVHFGCLSDQPNLIGLQRHHILQRRRQQLQEAFHVAQAMRLASKKDGIGGSMGCCYSGYMVLVASRRRCSTRKHGVYSG